MADIREVVLKAFTELAPSYERTVDWEVREFCGLGYREFIGRLVDMAPMGDDWMILDVASGTAISSLEIALRMRATSRVIGLDITPAMLSYGLENIRRANMGSRVSQVCASGMEMPFSEAMFEMVICGLGTHHMDVPRLLSETNRVLKLGGPLVLADMGAPARWRSPWGRLIVGTVVAMIRTLLRRSARIQAEADAVKSIRTVSEWRQVLSQHGFAVLEAIEWPPRRFWYPSALIMRVVKEGGA